MSSHESVAYVFRTEIGCRQAFDEIWQALCWSQLCTVLLNVGVRIGFDDAQVTELLDHACLCSLPLDDEILLGRWWLNGGCLLVDHPSFLLLVGQPTFDNDAKIEREMHRWRFSYDEEIKRTSEAWVAGEAFVQ